MDDEDSSVRNQIIALVDQISTGATGGIVYGEGVISEIISQDKHALCFLKYLNRIRGEIITIQHEPFMLINNIFLGILDLLYSHNGKFKKIHSEICNYVITLSQTIYKHEKKDKNILSEFVCKHPLWKTEIWWNVIVYVLFQEHDSRSNNTNKNELQSRREYMMILSILVTFKCSMSSFHCDDKMYIIKDIAKCYDIKDKMLV